MPITNNENIVELKNRMYAYVDENDDYMVVLKFSFLDVAKQFSEYMKYFLDSTEDLGTLLEYMKQFPEYRNKKGGDAMTGNEYQRLAARTFDFHIDQKDDMLRHAVFGLTSEAGEVAGILQKVYQGHDFDREHMLKELGDCLWFIAEACEVLEAGMSEVMSMNISKLRERYPEGFDPERSLNRKPEDV